MKYSFSFIVTDTEVEKLINIDDIDCDLVIQANQHAEALDNFLLEIYGHKNYEFCLGSDQMYMFLAFEAATRYIEWRNRKDKIGDSLFVKLSDVNRRSPYFKEIFDVASAENKLDETLEILMTKFMSIPTKKPLQNSGYQNQLFRINGPKAI